MEHSGTSSAVVPVKLPKVMAAGFGWAGSLFPASAFEVVPAKSEKAKLARRQALRNVLVGLKRKALSFIIGYNSLLFYNFDAFASCLNCGRLADDIDVEHDLDIAFKR